MRRQVYGPDLSMNSTPSSSIAAVERFGAVTSIDGVGGEEGHVWGVWVNDRAVSDLRRVTDFSVTPFGSVSVADGDSITFKLMNMD
ncbi:hypothetical protein C2W62_46525 [Candidatus Entotheonella serta]|nr:hypothetical protein C2W62_46525 [Candidatus Entotheonella serta]